MVKLHDIEQGTNVWFELRKGKLTGSNATPIGANGAGLVTYCKEVVLSTLGIEKNLLIGTDIERGNELEDYARMSYELKEEVDVVQIGFITNSKYEDVGVSPDGLVGEDGMIEIKAKNDIKHFSLILGEETEIPRNQIQMLLLVSERKWCDFVSYNPNFETPIFIKRIYNDEKYQAKLLEGFITGRNLITEYKNKYKSFVV